MSFQGGMSGRAVPPNGGYAPAPTGVGTPPGPFPPYMGPPPGGHRRGVLVSAGVVIAIMLAIAALVVGVVAWVHHPAAPPRAAPSPSPATAAPANTEAADRALCQAIAPLMKEATDTKKAFVNLGHTGTPERDAGIQQFQAATRDWAG